jgi:hypothetical protein
MDESKYAELRIELDTDPLGLGYAGTTDEQAAALLNTEGLADQQKDREEIPTWRLLTAVNDGEFALLTPTQLSMFQSVCACVQVDISNVRIRAMLQRIFVASNQTKANLIALAREPAARWETLDLGGIVAYWDVSRSRQL